MFKYQIRDKLQMARTIYVHKIYIYTIFPAYIFSRIPSFCSPYPPFAVEQKAKIGVAFRHNFASRWHEATVSWLESLDAYRWLVMYHPDTTPLPEFTKNQKGGWPGVRSVDV